MQMPKDAFFCHLHTVHDRDQASLRQFTEHFQSPSPRQGNVSYLTKKCYLSAGKFRNSNSHRSLPVFFEFLIFFGGGVVLFSFPVFFVLFLVDFNHLSGMPAGVGKGLPPSINLHWSMAISAREANPGPEYENCLRPEGPPPGGPGPVHHRPAHGPPPGAGALHAQVPVAEPEPLKSFQSVLHGGG